MANSLSKYATGQKTRKAATPQGERTPGRTDEVRNNAGGFVFKVSDRDRLERFLILGTDGATYYVDSNKQVKDNLAFLRGMVKRNEALVLDTIVEVSAAGRAYSNSPALFALAVVLTDGQDKARAKAVANDVIRTATHLFEFTEYLKGLGGMGRAKRAVLANWYESKTPESLAYQAVKYRQRNGYTHRDVFRIGHPKGVDQRVGNFILGKGIEGDSDGDLLAGFTAMQSAKTEADVLRILTGWTNLPWETIPTQFLKSPAVWKKIFYNGQLRGQALVRNVTRMARIGAFNDMVFAADYAAALTNEEMIAKTRLHPINYLNASVVYREGQVERNGRYGYSYYAGRRKDWTVTGKVADALDEGFHTAFKYVEPANKRTLVAIDVSGSMASPALGLDLSCAQVSAAVGMTIARTEPYSEIRGFTSGNRGAYYARGAAELTDLGITGRTGLATAMKNVQKNNFGGTDCSQPMLWAMENKVDIDTFVVITDNETWAGKIKPSQALKQYRDKTGIGARLAVMGVAGSPFTIADPADRGMMDFVGFDSAAPRALADFSAGRL